MIGKLLLRGMLMGLLASLLSFGLELAGEPSVDRAIAFENAMYDVRAKADQLVANGHVGHVGLGGRHIDRERVVERTVLRESHGLRNPLGWWT